MCRFAQATQLAEAVGLRVTGTEVDLTTTPNRLTYTVQCSKGHEMGTRRWEELQRLTGQKRYCVACRDDAATIEATRLGLRITDTTIVRGERFYEVVCATCDTPSWTRGLSVLVNQTRPGLCRTCQLNELDASCRRGAGAADHRHGFGCQSRGRDEGRLHDGSMCPADIRPASRCRATCGEGLQAPPCEVCRRQGRPLRYCSCSADRSSVGGRTADNSTRAPW